MGKQVATGGKLHFSLTVKVEMTLPGLAKPRLPQSEASLLGAAPPPLPPPANREAEVERVSGPPTFY